MAYPRTASRARRGRTCVALFLLVVQLGGCFRYAPVAVTGLPPGAIVAVGLNDPGRVALAETVGPGVVRIHGRLLESNDSTIALSMTSVEFMDLNVAARMAGERVEIRRIHTADVRERQLSRSRTALTIAIAVAGLVATSLIAISGFGGDGGSDRPGNGDGGQQ